MSKKLTTAEFIAKAQAVHGLGKYDYAQVVYVGDKTKVAIVCREHGQFEQMPSSHLSGCGCRKCGLKKAGQYLALNSESFIEKAQAVHGLKYDYSETVYVKQGVKVAIICGQHGAFSQEPSSHLQGCGCPKCANAIRAAGSTHDFIVQAQKRHPNKYDYSLSIYVSAWKKLKIICPQHGIFEQVAIKHSGSEARGCELCARLIRGEKKRKDVGHFIKKAREAHGDKYDYSLAEYNKSVDYVKIICPAHGIFEQQACMHITTGKRRPSGCPDCAKQQTSRSWIDRANGRICTLYLIEFYSLSERFYKIGITVNSLEQRYNTGNIGDYQYEILAQHTSTDAARIYDWEQSIIETFAHLRYRPKTRFAGETECFSSADEILAIFPL